MLTRAQLEKKLVGRTKGYLEVAKLSIVDNGTNTDLDDPINEAITDSGGTVINMSPTDEEIATVPDENQNEFVDRAEVRLLKTIFSQVTQTSFTIEGISIQKSDLIRDMRLYVALRDRQVTEQYGRPGNGFFASRLNLKINEPQL
jgi:hypothetical protein